MRKWLPLVAICAGTFMLLVDVTIVIVAMPNMADALHSSLADLQWVLDLYALVLGSLVLTAGSIADRVGRRTVYLSGLAIFAAGSLTCALSGDVGVLIAARGVQGLGAAAMFATTMALISSSYDGRDRGVAFGIWAAINGAASAAGPILGGLLTTHFGWRWIFLVNLPVCAVAVVLTLVAVNETRNPHQLSIDLPGMVSFTGAAAALVYALIRGSWNSPLTIGLLAAAAAALGLFIVIERSVRGPMLDLALLRNASFTTLLSAIALLPAAAWATLAFQSLWVQSVLGLSAIQAGLLIVPCSLTTFVVSVVVGRKLHAVAPHLLIGPGLLLIAVGGLAQGIISSGSSWAVEVPGLVLVGFGTGLVLAPLSAAAMAAVPAERAGMAAGAVNTFRQLGYALGIAVLGAVFRSALDHTAGHDIADRLSSGQAGTVISRGPGMAHLAHQAFASALDHTFVVAGGFAVLAGVAVLAFVRPRAATPAPTTTATIPATRAPVSEEPLTPAR